MPTHVEQGRTSDAFTLQIPNSENNKIIVGFQHGEHRVIHTEQFNMAELFGLEKFNTNGLLVYSLKYELCEYTDNNYVTLPYQLFLL